MLRRFGQVKCRDGEVIRAGRWGGDATAILRDLGLAPSKSGNSVNRRIRERITPDKALRYADALGIDPSELGL